jgi:hypothetical protein
MTTWTNWPTHTNGTNKTLGEMTKDEWASVLAEAKHRAEASRAA